MPINTGGRFVEKGPAVTAIQFDGSQDVADQIVELVSPPLRAEVVPKGQFNNDYDNCYVSVQSYYSIQYIGPGDWFVQRETGEVRLMHNIDFRREHIALSDL